MYRRIMCVLLIYSSRNFITSVSFFFFLKDTATPDIYPFPLPAPLPISRTSAGRADAGGRAHDEEAGVDRQRHAGDPARFIARQEHRRPRHVPAGAFGAERARLADRKSTRLNSSHLVISYAVFCLKKKNH